MQKVQPYIIGALFIVTGTLHFAKPATYEQIEPAYLPNSKALVQESEY